MTSTSPFHAAARALAKRGLAVVPCKPRTKVPALAGWPNLVLSDAAIDAWWEDNPEYNVGIILGAPARKLLVDIEMKKGLNGEADLRRIEEEYEPLPASVEAITPNGPGRHIYLNYYGSDVRSCYIAPGIEIKAGGFQVLAPPSIHPDTGTAYRWSVDSASKFADAPQWLVDLAIRAQGGSSNGLGKGKSVEQWHAVLANEIADTTRNVTLTQIAGKLFRHRIDPVLVFDMLLCVNEARCKPPLPAADVETIILSIGRKHLEQRAGGKS